MKRPFTKKYCSAPRFLAESGRPTKPEIVTSELCASTESNFWFRFLPYTFIIRWRRPDSGKLNISVSLWFNTRATCGLTRAIRSNSLIILRNSVSFDFRNLRRAGTLKNRFLIEKILPSVQASGLISSNVEPAMDSFVPNSVPLKRVRSSTWATAAIEASASPRNPIVWRENRSSAEDILEVACRSNAIRASVSDIPFPSSTTWINVRPASLMFTWICAAPASIAFSTSSFTTEAGR